MKSNLCYVLPTQCWLYLASTATGYNSVIELSDNDMSKINSDEKEGNNENKNNRMFNLLFLL